MIGTLHRDSAVDRSTVWRRVLPFLALAFGLTWLLDLGLQLFGGYGSPQTIVALQLQMLIPAASAILLGFFAPGFGPIAVRQSDGKARAFFVFFLALTALYVIMTIVALALPNLAATVAGVSQILTILSILVLAVLRLAGGRASFLRANLSFGKPVSWLIFGIGFILLYSLLTGLNALFGLGTVPDLSAMVAQSGLPTDTFMIVGLFQSVIVGPFLGIVIAFGEEYGWRGYLQSELVKLGRVRGILILGLIWGIWHAPIIMMGHNYPGYPVLGVFLMTAYTTLLAFILGYAMLKTGSVWRVAFLHALNNQVASTLLILFYTPADSAFQFVAGIYGLVVLAAVVALLLRDPIWRGAGVPERE